MINLILAILIVLSIGVFASIMTLMGDYKYYKKTYKELPNLIFTKAHDSLYNQVTSQNRNVIWFANKNDFKIGPFNYIHNSFITYLNPYTLYWFYRYKKWFNKHCKHLKKDIYYEK